MALVVDASIALAWGLPDETSAYADAVLAVVEREGLRVPGLWPREIANGLSVAYRRGRITRDGLCAIRLHERTFAQRINCPAGESAAKAAERRPDTAGEVDFLYHCFIAKCVLIGSSNYFFTAGPKRSTSSFHSAIILAFVFRAL
jgi:predicted nucleic acid-binding protein